MLTGTATAGHHGADLLGRPSTQDGGCRRRGTLDLLVTLHAGSNQFDITATNLDTNHASKTHADHHRVPEVTPTPAVPVVKFTTPASGTPSSVAASDGHRHQPDGLERDADRGLARPAACRRFHRSAADPGIKLAVHLRLAERLGIAGGHGSADPNRHSGIAGASVPRVRRRLPPTPTRTEPGPSR